MESKMEDRWLSIDEIGDYLGIKRDTVYKWISEKDEVDTWVRDGKARDFKEGEDQ
jgi:hypothetical protein